MPPESEKDLTAPTVARLSQYLLILEHLALKEQKVISSRDLAAAYGNTPSQVRQDVFQLHLQARSGQGYAIDELITGIRLGLGITSLQNLCIVGIGNLGRTLASHIPFDNYGMKIRALFDKDPAIIGTNINNDTVYDLENICSVIADKNITLAAICVPDNAAQKVSDILVKCGIKGILNYSRVRLQAPSQVTIHYQQMVCSFMQLSYAVSHPQI